MSLEDHHEPPVALSSYLATAATVPDETSNGGGVATVERPRPRRLSDAMVNILARINHEQRRGSEGGSGRGTGSGSLEGKALLPRKNSNSSVFAIDLQVFESQRRLSGGLATTADQGKRGSQGSLDSWGSTHDSVDVELPAPPPLSGSNNDGHQPMIKPGMTDDESQEPSCLICLGKFTAKRPPVLIPCSQRCNLTPVHTRCVFEWKEQSSGGSLSTSGSCPLCRSPLESLEYVPPDPLACHTLFMHSARRDFVSRPAPRVAGMVRAYVRVVGAGLMTSTPVRFEMYLQAPTTRKYPNVPLPSTHGVGDGDLLLMTARRKTVWRTGCSRIDVSLDERDFNRKGPKHLATVNGSLFGLDYTIKAPCKFDFQHDSKQEVELGSVRFEQNRIGSGAGPRKISVCLPTVRPDPVDGVGRGAAGCGNFVFQTFSEMNFTGIKQSDPEEEKLRAELDEQKAAAAEEDDEDDEDEAVIDKYMTVEYRPSSKRDSLRSIIRKRPPHVANSNVAPAAAETLNAATTSSMNSPFIFAQNRKPYYLESIAAFSLDFFGRVTLPSNKNFLLTCDTATNAVTSSPDSNILLFGKVGYKGRNADATVYTLDFQWPLSPLQAFCIALASCDRKMGCA